MDLPTYNTQKEKLLMSQYGRVIQDMVDYALTIEDRNERQLCAEKIIDVMANILPEKPQKNAYQSLWDHLAYMSDYKLDVDYPFEVTRMGNEAVKPAPLSYPQSRIRQRQYGKLLESSLEELAQLPPSEKRDELMSLVANRMKQSLCDWNPDAMDEDKIAYDLDQYTGGMVRLPEGFNFAKVDKSPLASNTGKSKKNKKKYK